MSLQEGTVSVEMANNKNWSWSIHPLVFWTRVLSIGTLNDNRAKTYRERCVVFYGFFCLSCNFISQVMCVSYIFENFNHNSKNYVSQDGFNSNASAWNTAIDFVNFAVHTVSVHLFLIFFFRSRWTLLMNAVENLEPLFNAETFVKIRRTCIVCLTYIISMVITLCASLAYYHAIRGASWDVIFFGFVSTVSQIHPLSVVGLFLVVAYAISCAYQTIWSDLNIFLTNATTDSQRYANLLTLKYYHILVCETIDYTNHCFGWILVLYVAFHYIAVITSSFYLFGQIGTSNIMPHVFLTLHSFHLTVVCSTADFLRYQSERVMRKLVELQLNMKEPMKSLISAFSSQVGQFSPEVTGVDFFLVNKRIILKVITTALTYFIILYQFHSSEKEIVPA